MLLPGLSLKEAFFFHERPLRDIRASSATSVKISLFSALRGHVMSVRRAMGNLSLAISGGTVTEPPHHPTRGFVNSKC